MEKTTTIGLDVGNHDTKTSNTTTTSGYSVFSTAPFGAKEILHFNNKFYVPNVEPSEYTRDKTSSDRCFTLSMIGIAKEILEGLDKKNLNKDQLQSEIEKYKVINLGVGLPPAHMARLASKTQNYYEEYFGPGVEYEYNNLTFSYRLGTVKVYPQDYAAIITYKAKPDFITNKYNTYYAIDLGGFTVDVVPIVKNRPDVKNCVSLEMGVLKLYSQIIATVDREHGIYLDTVTIRNVLSGEPTILKPEVISTIYSEVDLWLAKILNKLRQDGLEFEKYPVVFLGGGSKLFRKQIKNNKIISYCEFISNPRANADGFKKLLDAEIRAGRS